ncbi:hypothetical protein [Polaromonas sp. YR568]|uniref:hypothetical protein n=1 Tax=Polaromonas sp. YR568 TaxID=1855301 RepID=UPI00313793C7
MRIKLIEDLPMASSAELYQLSWAIEKLLADPRRVVQARRELHMGQQVKFMNWGDGKWLTARIVSMKRPGDGARGGQPHTPEPVLRRHHDDAIGR